MAFATSNLVCENRGSSNELRGNWSCAIGDAAGTVTINGIALDADFRQNGSTPGPHQARVQVSGLGTNTVTIYHLTDVTSGVFWIRYK